MSSTGTTASTVLDAAAALMNDVAKSIFSNAAQLPYLNIACNELQEWCEVNNIPVSQETSAIIEVSAGDNKIVSVDDPDAATLPNYPSDLIDIQQIWERTTDTENEFTPVTKFDYIPHWWETDPPTSSLECWAWLNQQIRFGHNGATADNDVKLDYIKTLFPQTITANTTIGIINSSSFLSYRLASLLAQYIGENPTRAEELRAQADVSLDRMLTIGTKGRQSIPIRRRPFMANYKSRISDW